MRTILPNWSEKVKVMFVDAFFCTHVQIASVGLILVQACHFLLLSVVTCI